MFSNHSPWLLAMLTLTGATVDSASPDTLPAPLEHRVDGFLQPYVDAGHLSGTLLIARDGRIEYEKSFRLADQEHGVPNTPQTRFCVGSITKPMTIVVLARVLESGQIELTDPLAKFLPWFPRAEEITVGHLLNHRSGIIHRVTEPLDETRPQTPASMARLAARKELVFEPGAESVYSSAGFSVLARVLEVAAGKPFAQLLDEYVWQPAGMTGASDAGTRALLPRRASSYYFDPAGLVNAPPADVSYLVGAGSVFSTARDLLSLQQALLHGRLGHQAQELLLTDTGKLRWNGSALGYRAFADHDSASGITIILVSNLTSGALDRIRDAVPRIVAGEVVPAPEPVRAVPAAVDPELLRLYQGAYELRPGRNLELRVDNARVTIGEWLLIPTSQRTFFSPQDYAEVRVVLDDQGAVTRLDWTTRGRTHPLPRVAEPATPPAERASVDAIDSFITPFVELAMFDGTVLVDVGGEIRFEKSFGRAHYELDVAHDTDTKFRIASVSKTLTDAAFGVLIQRQVLTPDTPVSTYLPDFPAAARMTVRHLLNHASGVGHTNDQPWGDGSTSLTLDELIRRLAATPLDFEPGTDRKYSNGGYAVAAKILELAGGAPFAEVMNAVVFEPLGMTASGHIADARTPISGIATGYEPGARPGERRRARFYAVETRPGGGSLYSSARDLLRFARALFRDGLLDKPLLESMLGAGDGPFLSQGRAPGFVAKFYYDPARDLIVISLANNYAVAADWAATIGALAAGVAERSTWPPIRRAPGTIATSDRRLGRYTSSRGGELTLARNGHGELVLSETPGAPLTGLFALADGAFLLPSYYQRCEQAPATRVVTCTILSGDPRYTSIWTPVE